MSVGSEDVPIEVHRLSPEWVDALTEFFRALDMTGDSRHFHPHPLTADEAARRCGYQGDDLYYVLVQDGRILGYGFLRGWDEGYTVPSLGIAIHPSERGKGLGKVFMHFLHTAAKRKGASKVRLKVHPDNATAVSLYEELGYTFHDQEKDQLVGTRDLG